MTRHALLIGLLVLTSQAALPAARAAALAPDDDQAAASQDIDIRDTSIQILRPDRRIAAGYFTIENRGKSVHLLAGVSSPACPRLFAHHTEQESTGETANLFMHLALPAQTTLVFPPGGYHLICSGYDDNLRPGQQIVVTFRFMGGATRSVPFVVHPTADTGDATTP
ncbi:copper chaperone PCu(A)C [Gluconacetobacter takamatsuzukensis]|uniref:Copper chaperone PCu(A)C n=1 Tax=Gluconacetobacter takamatsuzukensis TaxID=1286190 RepID=A0A7W4PRZ0_9PROT|nr:copper chaperone PCu(A)C [Gluconacetobacter takamatsuzukensis]MBB2204401.1 copper chaperone PCu(A)C [Gluconacetobacter takamatsuzukensis]